LKGGELEADLTLLRNSIIPIENVVVYIGKQTSLLEGIKMRFSTVEIVVR
jgi:hypothetical protein